MWVGGVADSQTRSKPLKTTPNHPKNRPFLPEFHLLFSQISQKPLGGWVNRFDLGLWEISQKKVFFGRASQYCTAGKLYYATSADSGAAGFSSGTSWLNMINAGPASTFILCKYIYINWINLTILNGSIWNAKTFSLNVLSSRAMEAGGFSSSATARATRLPPPLKYLSVRVFGKTAKKTFY